MVRRKGLPGPTLRLRLSSGPSRNLGQGQAWTEKGFLCSQKT